MKKILVLIWIAVGCQSQGYIYQPPHVSRLSVNGSGYIGSSELVYEKHPKSRVSAFIGYYAIDNYDERTDLRINECSEYYRDEQLKNRGNYQIGKYVHCCAAGPCEQFYHYKVGKWLYYHPNGQLQAVCVYQTNVVKIYTSCEGGNMIKFNTLDSIVVFDENGKEVVPGRELSYQLNEVRYSGHVWNVVNNEIVIK